MTTNGPRNSSRIPDVQPHTSVKAAVQKRPDSPGRLPQQCPAEVPGSTGYQHYNECSVSDRSSAGAECVNAPTEM